MVWLERDERPLGCLGGKALFAGDGSDGMNEKAVVRQTLG